MKNWVKIYGILLSLGLCLHSCGLFQSQDTSWNPDGSFSIQTPSYLSLSKKVSPGASLQLGNTDKDIFFVLRINSKDSLKSKFSETGVEDIFTLHMDNLTEKLEGSSHSNPDSIHTSYLSGLEGSIRGNYKGNMLQHQLVILEDSNRIYQVLYWMPEKQWKAYQADFARAVESLRPLDESNMP